MKLVLPIDLERVPKWAKVTIGILVAVLVLIVIIKANEDEVRQKQFWQQCCQLCWFSLRKWQFENPKDWQLGRVGDTDHFPCWKEKASIWQFWRRLEGLIFATVDLLIDGKLLAAWEIVLKPWWTFFLTLLNIMVFLVTVKKEPSVIFLIRSMTFSRSNHHENVI